MSHMKKKKMVNKQPLEGLLVLEEVLMDALAKAPGTLVEAAVEVDMLAKLEQELGKAAAPRDPLTPLSPTKAQAHNGLFARA